MGWNTLCARRCFFSLSDGAWLFAALPQSLGLPGLHCGRANLWGTGAHREAHARDRPPLSTSLPLPQTLGLPVVKCLE